MNAKQLWHAARGELQRRISPAYYDTWVKHATVLDCEDEVLVIGVPSTFAKEWLETRLLAQIRRTISGIAGRPMDVRVEVQHAQRPPNGDPALSAGGRAEVTEARVAAPADRPSANGGLNPRYTFATFIVGNSNRLAHAAAAAVAARPATAYNPLFIYGGVGLGKTHLLHAIGHEMRRQGRAVTYVSSERFTNDLINAIRMQRTEEFRARYRTADALLIDDIQFIAGKEGTQEEFFHTFNALHEATRQIVLSSDRPPKAMVALEERLRSRFEWGLIADIQPPDLETRLAILRAKAETQPTPVPPEVLDFLARRVQSNIRELEGSLNRVVALAMLSNQQLTIEVARDALLEMHDDRGRPRATPRRVVEVVAEYYGLDVAALRGKKRDKNVVVPRQVAMYLLREVTDCSLQEIGQELGGRDHTTVHHGYEKIAHEINVSNELRRDVFAIRERLSNPEQARGK